MIYKKISPNRCMRRSLKPMELVRMTGDYLGVWSWSDQQRVSRRRPGPRERKERSGPLWRPNRRITEREGGREEKVGLDKTMTKVEGGRGNCVLASDMAFLFTRPFAGLTSETCFAREDPTKLVAKERERE